MTPSMTTNFSCICVNDYTTTQSNQTHHLCHLVTTIHAYSHGWVIMISKDYVMMIIKICNVTMTIMEDASNG
jgi:hypothetical protein